MVGTWYLLAIFPIAFGHSGFHVCVQKCQAWHSFGELKACSIPTQAGYSTAQLPAAAQTEEVRAACSSNPHYFTFLLELLHLEMFLHMGWSSMQRYLSKVGGIIPAVEANQQYEHGQLCRMDRGGKLSLCLCCFACLEELVICGHFSTIPWVC